MPRKKADDPRNQIFAIRLTLSERQEISRRAGKVPMGQWIRERALASLETRQPDNEKPPSTERVEPCEQTEKVHLHPQPQGEWAKHPVMYQRFRECIGREPTPEEWVYSPDSP